MSLVPITRRFVIYAVMGTLGTVAHYALLLALVGAGCLAPAPASMCGAVVGALINFILNARFTFGAAVTARMARRFLLTAAAGTLFNGLGMTVLVDLVRLDFRLSQVFVTLGVLGLTFVVNSLWTFRTHTASRCIASDPH